MIVQQQKEAAEILGVTATAVRKWEREPGFPDCANGYDIPAIRTWLQLRGKRNSDAGDQMQKLKLAREAQRLTQDKLDTERKQDEKAVRRGDLVPRPAVELFAATLLTELADWTTQLPDLVEQVVPQKYRKKLVKRLTEALDSKRRQTALRLEQHARDLDAANVPT